MSKQKPIFGKYDSNVKIGLFFSFLALFLILPMTIDFQNSVIWTGFISGPVIFGVFAGFALAKKIKPSTSDILITALAFSIIYITGLFISPDTIFTWGENWIGTIIMVYVFSAVGVLIGKYSLNIIQ